MKLTRRALLLGGVLATTGCSGADGGFEPPPILRDNPVGCRTPEELTYFSDVAGAELGYEVDRASSSMRSDPRFLERLNAWAADWVELSGLGPLATVWSYGAYVDKCNSWHAAGRAFDVAELVHEGGTVSCRFDRWTPGTEQQLRDYWRLAASLHEHFAYTLTYAYNSSHHNHIHVDNGVSRWERSSFNQRSRVQVQFVQHALRHVHGVGIELTDSWDAQTRDALRPVQARLGITTPMGEPEGWRAFLRATAAAR